jgi:hypothetical protein
MLVVQEYQFILLRFDPGTLAQQLLLVGEFYIGAENIAKNTIAIAIWNCNFRLRMFQ